MSPAAKTPAKASRPRPPAALKRRAEGILSGLRATYPDARTELEYQSPFELLIATVLSAQATDKSVNAATPALFAAYPDAQAMSAASVEAVEALIKSIGLYRNKAKNLVALSGLLLERHGGEVPNDFAAVVTLPGAGRKTANVVLSNAYGMAAIAVDTHVGRLARRLGLSEQTNPDKVELDLQALFPQDSWIFLHHALILHGRRVCLARRPLCSSCTLLSLCPRLGVESSG
ncbi:endonuclease III [Deinococcus detaillensis]|uniref:Endonuclease III n=1 Tax=Deinococcus detaillensis TaxID=2592048 RepID=A0A553V4D8_9DEIO|nr:endonuclease III [Deinococcus detaillensis]TSA87316.1 endonuclease III [Deinococcus detaillensis]